MTSSAAVGSSATRRRGPPARARARSARWRIPPESWWGNAFHLPCGIGKRRRARASARPRPPPPSATGRDAVRSRPSAPGRSSAPGRARRPAPGRRARSRRRAGAPFRARGAPARRGPRRGRPRRPGAPEEARGRRARATSGVLPQPDSPTRATISPASTSKETPSTAGTSPPDGPGTAIVRARTERSGARRRTRRISGEPAASQAGASSLSRSPTSRNEAFEP